MKDKITSKTWVFVIIVNPGKNEKILGQTDHENNISFIPIFRSRSIAEKGIQFIPNEIKNEYEIQAIIYEDLVKYAVDEKCFISIVDENGAIEDRIIP